MKTRRKLGRMASVLAVAAAAAGIGFGLTPIQSEQARASETDVFLQDGLEALARQGGGAAPGRPAEEAAPSEHDLSALRLVSRVMHLVDENYVDPERVKPREMLLGALDYIEKRIPEVLVDERRSDETGTVQLTVNRVTRTIQLTELNTIWDLTSRLREAFAFIQQNLVTTEDTRVIEYAAINGMLSTLDPHSNLLDPEQYNDMKLHTRGEFGGLGFVVSMRDGRLTVMRVIPNTPAHKGGIQARDMITRIEDESTVNMDLTEAVNRLRGKPGTPVNFWVERGDFEEPRRFTLIRAVIEIESIDPVRLLEDSVGYVRVTNFQGHTTRDLRAAVTKLQQEADGDLKGLILDLRGNPGGLLEQAIQVSDLFIERGTIVSTVGMNNRLRERKTASRSGTLADLPLIVLVSNSSASASEIVGGAVRNLDRGLVIGNPTFGKGSVQVLYDLVDESALKLTIAQYLTPGDISIQDMGIVPDIELLPALVSQKRVMVFAPRRSMRESDLASAGGDGPGLAAPSPGLDPFRTGAVDPAEETGQQPLQTVTFLRDDVPDDEEIDEFEEPEWKEDFHVSLAREILARAGAPTRRAMLERARAVIDERKSSERRRIYDSISDLGIDWTPTEAPTTAAASPPVVDGSLSFDGPALAGKETHLALTLTNRGDRALHRVRAWTETSSPMVIRHSMLFDRIEFLFGKLDPGESRTWKVPVELPADLLARREMLDIRVEAEGLDSLPPIKALLDVEELPAPNFAFGWQVATNTAATEDGRLPVGENSELDIFVHNLGEGASSEAVVTIRGLEDQHVYINRGRHRIGEMAPGETSTARMTLEVREGFEGEFARIQVTVYDRDLAQYTSDEIRVPVARARAEATTLSGAVRLRADSHILGWAADGARQVARVGGGATLPVDARIGDMYRVQWGEDRTGFLPESVARPVPRSRRAASGEIQALLPHRPPRITVTGAPKAPVTSEDSITISGLTEAEYGLRDLYIFINNDKVFFRAWEPEQATAESADQPEQPAAEQPSLLRLPFEATLPLEEGANSVVIFARKSDDLHARHQMVVFRTPTALVVQEPAADGAGGEAADAEKSGEVETDESARPTRRTR